MKIAVSDDLLIKVILDLLKIKNESPKFKRQLIQALEEADLRNIIHRVGEELNEK